MATVLIVDDDASTVGSLVREFEACEHTVARASNGTEALAVGRQQRLDAAILDLCLNDVNGLRVARELRLIHPRLVCLAAAGFAMLPEALRSMSTAFDAYIEKPFEASVLVARVERLLAERAGKQVHPSAGIDLPTAWHGMVGVSLAMRRAFRQGERIAVTGASVLIAGETGTGKELMARAIHALSPRRNGPFVAVNSTSAPESLFEDAFFGHVRGAFTGAEGRHAGYFEEAQGGTLFLDEIGDLPVSVQTKLLRVLEERAIRPVGGRPVRIDVRILSATNADLATAIEGGRFRHDLFHRLNEFGLRLPPLRERGDDVELLIDRFLADMRSETPGVAHALSNAARARLLEYHWPGNVRELRATVRRAALLAELDVIDLADLPVEFHDPVDPPVLSARLGPDDPPPKLADALRDSRARIERDLVERALTHCQTRQAAARALGIHRRTLLNLRSKHGIRAAPRRRLR